jgi:hypothetical protein
MATITIPDDWAPTAANINALPMPLRRFIMQLETHMDPQLTLQQLHACEQNTRALAAMVAMLRED